MKDRIAYCGLDCERCDAYIATQNNDQALREKTAKFWSEINNAKITPEDINCEGCKSDGVKTIFCDQLCNIKKCAKQKEYATCGNCSERTSCDTLKDITDYDEDARNRLQQIAEGISVD